MFALRPYQTEAIEALHTHICTKQTNPCIVLPTGSGKSVVMAATIQQWRRESPWVRGCVLAHRKELVKQNSEKMRAVYPDGRIGIFSAGLGERDYESPVLFASIDSIYKRAGEFQPFDFLFVDEAHRIPPAGEGKYRTFINECRRFNQSLRVIGWTATPFRMGCGNICHKDHILNEVCYDAKITDIIAQGYLCRLRSKVGETQPNLKDVARNSGGDYRINSLASATNRVDVVSAAISEAVKIMSAEQRRAAVFFCVDIAHCERVSAELQKYGIYAPFVTSKTNAEDRDNLVRRFRSGEVRAICNVNVFTEGFDVSHIDCIVLLRPTLSAGLFSQMVGRGLRLHPQKDCCLILDFAGCIDEHGPIDLIHEDRRTVLAVCERCRESFSRAVRMCPQCGWEIPKQEIERLQECERGKNMHGTKPSNKSILSNAPQTYKVDSVYVSRHTKTGSPDSIKVQYRCGLSMFREWVCLDHPGYAGQKAASWWRQRFSGKPSTVSEALQDMFLSQTLLEWTRTITVRKSGKFYEVVAYNQSPTNTTV